MSLLKSNPAVLALGANAIALKRAGDSAKSLTSAETCYTSSRALCDALRQVANQIEAQAVRVIVSNHYVRYLALPWQAGLARRDDWLAMAQHAFRTHFGNIAEQWEVRVHFNGYGKQVTACAIDQSLLDELYAIAAESNWHIAAIEPLWMALLPHVNIGHATWLLQVEPERALLCEFNHGEWQHFAVVNPPAGQEQAQSLQLLTRQLQATEHKPKQVHVCASPALRNHWHSDVVRLNIWSPGNRTNANNAVWMAEL